VYRLKLPRSTKSESKNTDIDCSHFWTTMVSPGTTTTPNMRFMRLLDIGVSPTGALQKNP
jgi:hypothetical protein